MYDTIAQTSMFSTHTSAAEQSGGWYCGKSGEILCMPASGFAVPTYSRDSAVIAAV